MWSRAKLRLRAQYIDELGIIHSSLDSIIFGDLALGVS